MTDHVDRIRQCFHSDRVLYTRHAREEMETEEFGEILDEEVNQAIMAAKLLEDYPGHSPYPSCLLLGRSEAGRPIHVVCAYAEDSDMVIVITVYQPDPERWIDYERRKP